MIKVLIVDDSPMDRALVSGLVSKRIEKSQIFEACNGREGLSRIEADQPTIVLTDLQMPEMDGLELVTSVKIRFPHIPVILMTAQGSEDIAAQALQQGAASYVPKRRLSEDLVRTIERVLATAQEERRQSVLMHHMTDNKSSFSLQNDPELLQLMVSHLLDLLRCMPLGDEAERLRVGIALGEAFNNALYHGNLEISADGDVRNRKQFESLALQRLSERPYCDRKIHVQIQISPAESRFSIRDEGPGFDTSKLQLAIQAPTNQASYGRGTVLMQSIMDDVSFNEAGNEVTLVKRSVAMDDMEDADDE